MYVCDNHMYTLYINTTVYNYKIRGLLFGFGFRYSLGQYNHTCIYIVAKLKYNNISKCIYCGIL